MPSVVLRRVTRPPHILVGRRRASARHPYKHALTGSHCSQYPQVEHTLAAMSAPVRKLNPPFRADHIGSLKRPLELLEKRKEFDEGKCSAEERKVVEDEAISQGIQMQREVGIKAMTDGEFRRCVSVGPWGVRRGAECRAQTHVLRWRL